MASKAYLRPPPPAQLSISDLHSAAKAKEIEAFGQQPLPSKTNQSEAAEETTSGSSGSQLIVVSSSGDDSRVDSSPHPFGMENEGTEEIQGTGMFLVGSRPNSRSAEYNQENQADKVLDDFKVVMDYVSKNSPPSSASGQKNS